METVTIDRIRFYSNPEPLLYPVRKLGATVLRGELFIWGRRDGVVCEVTMDGGSRVVYGNSLRRPNDPPDNSLGAKIALANALRLAFPEKDWRAAVWKGILPVIGPMMGWI